MSVLPNHLLKFSLISTHDVEEEDKSEEKGERKRFFRSYGLVLVRITVGYLRRFIA